MPEALINPAPTASRARRAAEPIVRVSRLRKAYGDKQAVNGIDIEVRAGEIFTFLWAQRRGKDTGFDPSAITRGA